MSRLGNQSEEITNNLSKQELIIMKLSCSWTHDVHNIHESGL